MSERLPSFKPRELVALLKRAGFQTAYQDSSHLYLRHPDNGRTTCVPIHPGDVKRGLALKIDTSGPVWTELERLYLMVSDKNPLAMAATHAAAQPESTPWLGVILLPSLSIQTKETIRWLGDLETCMAWSIVADEVIKNR